MFGGGSTWGQNNNNNQQQQQPQQGGLFGGGGFGQQQQQQQQPQQTGFGSGGFGQQPAATGGGLFGGNTQQTSTFGGGGGFGAAAQPTSTFGAARPTFGATGQSTFGATPATGGGLFGNTSSTFGGASNQPATGGMFGAKPAQTNTFGSGATSGLFGAKPASPFGAANTGSTQAQNPNTSNPYYGDRPAPAPPTTGTADPAYFPSWQQDPSGTSSTSNLPPHLFHNVSAMEAYRGASPDELRAMDYQQNRKNATPQQPAAGGFGAPATGGFGQAAPTNTFGQQPATSTFGAKPAGGMFGAAPAANTGFGQSSGGFGQSSTGGGMFGQTQQQPASTGFGQPAQTGGLFGQPAQAPATGGGLFGNTSTGFGAQPAQPAATNTFGSFGAAKPATTGFGAPAAGGFGSGPATNTFGQTPAAGTGSTFGGFGATQNQNQQQAPATGGLFGGGGGFGQNNQQQQPAAATGGLFGQPAQQPAQPAAGGLFGAAAPKPGGLFGGASTTPAAGASTGFSFGQNNTQQPAQTGGLFGSTNNTNNNTTGGGLFGTQNNQQQGAQQPAAGGLFGGGGGMFGAKPAAPATGGLFGSTTQNQQQPAQTGSLFGNTGQSSGGLFGSTNNTLGQQNQQQNQPKPGGLFGGGGGMFGQTQQQPQQNTTGGGLFGGLGQSQPAQTSLFGNQNQQQPQQNGMNSSLFGGLGQSTNNQSQQPSLNASIDQNPYGRNELFNYTGQKLEFGSQNKKPALPPLTASSYRITPSKNQINKLRGFATPQSPGRASSPLSSSSRNGLNSPASDRYKGLTDTALTPNAFIPRPSIKRLNVTPKTNGVNGDDHLESVLGKSALKSSTSRSNLNVSQNGLSNSATLTFNPPSSLTATNGNGNGNQDTPTRRPTPLESSRPLAVAGSERQPSQGQYWCKPRMEKLRQMGEGYLSKIPNFTIGRSGFGEVTFLEPVDVTAFDLNDLFGKVVVFTEMELAVYPDDWEDKPPQGQGLNRPARITLLNCYPRDKATKQFITDVNDPRHARFLKRVKNIPETEFVSYTDDGAWTFEVKHFSKYGLRDGSDEDDEDVGDVGAIKRKTVNNGPKSAKAREAYNRPPSRTPSRTPESDEDFLPPTKSIRDMEQDVEEEESVSEGEGSETASEQDSASDQDQASSSRSESGSAPPEYDGMEPAQLKLGPEGFKNLQEMQSAHFDFEPRHIRPEKRQVKRTLGSHLAGFGNAGEDEKMLDRAIKRPSFGLKPSAPVLRQARKYAKVSLADGVESGKEGVKVDAGLAMGRSFRCSWGPNGELVHFGKICSPFTKFTPSSAAEVIIENVSILTEDAETESSRAQRLLRLHLDHSTIQTFDGIPQATLSTSIRFRDFASVFDTGDRSHEATIFRLGQALFDEIDLLLPPNSPDELVERISQLRRKLALSKWLENAVAPSVDSDLIKNGENRAAKVFSLLSGNKVARAVDMALEGNDMRLASLISQAGRTGEFRDEMLRQLSDWNKYDANPLIAAEYRRLYALLAGIMDVSPSRSGDISISKDLDWKRAFGLYLWFGCSFESTITDVFDEFTSALNSSHPPAEPLPPFLESKSDVKWNIPSQPTDILYQLIRVFSDATVSLDQVLQPRNCSASPTDLRLPWHLYLIVSRVMQKRDFVDRDEEGYSALADGITQGYAAQLELGGQWLNAAFVLLHLETIEGREKAIRALLHRHPDPSSEDVNFLTSKLQIPVQWIHESHAALLASSGDAWGEYHALLKAQLWNRAHRVLIDKLAPEAVLRGDMSLLGRLCEGLVGKVDGWEYGGQLFIDYINTTTEVPLLLKEALTTRQIQPRLTQLANDLPRLLRLLPALFPGEGVQSVACLSDMLSALHHLAGQLSLGGSMTRPAVSDSMVDVDRLHLLQASAFDAFSAALEGVTA